MKLFVQLLEARNLKPSDRPCQAYAQLKLGNAKRKSSISPSGAQDPYWFENFSFDVDDLGAELSISIWSHDRLSNVFLGRLRLPVAIILTAEKQVLPSSWYPLQKRNNKAKTPVTGEVRVSLSLSGSKQFSKLTTQISDTSSSSSVTSTPEHFHFHNARSLSTPDEGDETLNGNTRSSSAFFLYGFVLWLSRKLMRPLPNVLVAWFSSQFPWFLPLAEKHGTDTPESMEEATEEQDFLIEDEGSIPPSFFEDDGICIPSSEEEMPTPLKGGVLLSGTYMMSAKALNGLLFGSGSQFLKDLTELQKTTNLVEGPWTKGEHDLPKRVVKYVKAATKLVSSVKATEEQEYARADEKGFVVNVTAITPDVPYGSSFKVNVQYCIFSGSNTNTGEMTSLMRISWAVHFLTSTVLKSFIEKGARQGLQENYKQFAQLLDKYARPQQESSKVEGAAHILEPSRQGIVHDGVVLDSKSNWQLAGEFFCNMRVWMTLFLTGMVLAHIYSSKFNIKSRFEIWRIDLPDSFCELIIAAFLGAQIQSIVVLAKTLLSAKH